MKDDSLISVLMGIYNCETTLREAVRCIQMQTCPNWELILCDDCSSDRTYQIAEALAAEDARIVLLKNESNMTLAPTLNRCFAHAKGEYIARMDGDDVCPPDRFEKELAVLRSNPDIAIVSCLMDLYDDNGVYRTVQYPQYPAAADFIHRSQFCHAGCMMRASALRAVGGYREEREYARVEDYDLWVRMYAAGYKGMNIQEPLYQMRDDRNAIHRRSWQNRKNESRVVLQACRAAGVSPIKYIHALKPIAKWFVPQWAYAKIHRSQK